LQPRINASSRIVATIDTTKEPTQPNRLEKNANTGQQPLYLSAAAGDIRTSGSAAGGVVTIASVSSHQTKQPEQTG
jgi:hypothetical protein